MPKFVPRQRKHKVLARQSQVSAPHSDSNTTIIIPESATQRESRRAQLREELRAQQPKVSSKKSKRLDKYIETKLRKEENLDYLKRLEHEREKFDAGAAHGFQSSKRLNDKKRSFHDFVNGQVDDGKNGDSGKVVKSGRVRTTGTDAVAAGSSSDDGDDRLTAQHDDAFAPSGGVSTDDHWLAGKAPAVSGRGLAKPLAIGPDGIPIIPTRANQKKTQSLAHDSSQQQEQEDSTEAIWEGFSTDAEGSGSDLLALDDGDEEESESVDEDVEATDSSADDSDGGSSWDSETSTSTPETQTATRIKPRVSAFKSWATQQLNQSYGHTPSYAVDDKTLEFSDPPPDAEPVPMPKLTPTAQPKIVNGLPEVEQRSVDRQIHSVTVTRPVEVQAARNELPIIQKEQEIMEAIYSNPVVIIKGETGSGKTTQVPQFLYEAGFGDVNGANSGMIGVTQPRRVAAVSMARRVAEELGSDGDRVAHQVRFDTTVKSDTAVKFMTDGILLRELSQDLLLQKYSVIIIDEAHERSVNTDLLIGMLSKIVPARMRKDKFNPDPRPLKLIIMSATLNIGDFLNDRLFAAGEKPPVVEAEGRQHRVTTHFALRSRPDYIEETFEKVKRAHRKLPKGGILVFLTGQNEIKDLQRRLRADLRTSTQSYSDIQQPRMHVAAREEPLEADDLDFATFRIDLDKQGEDEVNIQVDEDDELENDEFDVTDDEAEASGGGASVLGEHVPFTKHDPYDSIHILPLYSQLPSKEQLRVFDEPPARSRMIVLATNVAETSITIPGIRYVFDCGRSKERKYDLESGVQSFEIDYISKASAQQRAGRAGRTGPGHCWRLYSSAVYEQYFLEHSRPEIVRTPAESVVLQIKSFAYPRPVVNFPFPTAPFLENIDKAEKLLKNLGALDTTSNITSLGHQLSNFPLSPRLGKVLITAAETGKSIDDAIRAVAGLAVGDLFISEAQVQTDISSDGIEDKSERDSHKQQYGRAMATLTKADKQSDIHKIWSAVSGYMSSIESPQSGQMDYCETHFLKHKAMAEVHQLVRQLQSISQANRLESPSMSTVAKQTSGERARNLNLCTASGYIDQVAIRWDCAPSAPPLPTTPRRAIDVPYIPLIPLPPPSSSTTSSSYATSRTNPAIFLHPSSVLSRLSVKELPQYIVYSHLQQSQPHTIVGNDEANFRTKTRMFPLTPIDAKTLAHLARDTALIEYGKPLQGMKIEDVLGVVPKQRICWVGVELRAPKGLGHGHAWPLPPVKVRQIMDLKSRSSGWRVEEVLG